MFRTCNNVCSMPKMIQIRHVPDSLHRKVKARAATEGLSLSDYLIREIAQLAELPTLQETLANIAKLPPVEWNEPVVDTIRRMRDSR